MYLSAVRSHSRIVGGLKTCCWTYFCRGVAFRAPNESGAGAPKKKKSARNSLRPRSVARAHSLSFVSPFVELVQRKLLQLIHLAARLETNLSADLY